MVLKVFAVKNISKKVFKNRVNEFFFDKTRRKIAAIPRWIVISMLDINVYLFDRYLIFEYSSNNFQQGFFVKKCIEFIFSEAQICYDCSEEISWLKNLENINCNNY